MDIFRVIAVATSLPLTWPRSIQLRILSYAWPSEVSESQLAVAVAVAVAIAVAVYSESRVRSPFWPAS